MRIPFELELLFDDNWSFSKNKDQPHLIVEPSMFFWQLPDQYKKRVYRVVFWDLNGADLQLGQSYEYQLKAKVAIKNNDILNSWVEVEGTFTTENKKDKDKDELEKTTLKSELISLHVKAKADVIKYLPSVYQEGGNDLIGRYLMIFESFWKIFDDRIKNMPNYFDPNMAPPDFQPWLASWVGMIWDERIPEDSRQELMFEIFLLFQKRGTKYGLQKYLQICLNVLEEEREQRIKITESPVGNFILGSNTYLRDELILGSPEDIACKFIVELILDKPTDKQEEAFIRETIETWKPAHTAYELYFS